MVAADPVRTFFRERKNDHGFYDFLNSPATVLRSGNRPAFQQHWRLVKEIPNDWRGDVNLRLHDSLQNDRASSQYSCEFKPPLEVDVRELCLGFARTGTIVLAYASMSAPFPMVVR